MCGRTGTSGDEKGIDMKIQKLELKNFGRFSDESFELKDGLQIVYGENEAGKSTLHTFIKGILFGMERGRGRASVNDTFSRYEPWDNPNYYSGAITFESGQKTFRLERNFDKYSKKAVLICQDDGEELSVEDGDLEMILDGLTASEYEDTLFIGQLHAKTSQALAAELKNYATNYYVSGDSEMDLAMALDTLKEEKKQVDREVRQAAEKKQTRRERIEQEATYVWRDIHQLEESLEDVNEEILYRKENEREQQTEQENKNKRMIDELRPDKWRIHPLEVLGIIAVIIIAFILIARPWNYLVSIIIALAGGIYAWNRLKEGKRKTKTEPEMILEEIMPEEERISSERLLWEKEHLAGELKEKQIQYDNLKEQIEELNEISEDTKEQERKKLALTLAIKRLQEISGEMQSQMSIDLNQKASEIMGKITDGRYTRLLVEEDLHMSLIKEGRKVSMEQVSQGTLEQIYFALRMSVSELMHEEEYPVILDDTFVFYDERRLGNTLRWLAQCRQQVILFTCQKREEEVLEKMGIPYSVLEI